MINFVTEGEVLEVTAGVGGITSGDPVLVGSVVGVAVSTVAETYKTAVNCCGVYELAKANVAVAQGDRLYWDAGNKVFTNVATGVYAGFAYEAALQAATTVKMRLGKANAQAAKVAACATVDGSDAGTTQALANALKVKLNAILTALTDAGLMSA
jgi:predicted RecA/RadA family phage recombinase